MHRNQQLGMARPRVYSLPEHPVWEDLIDLRNIETEIREIEDDIKRL